MKIRINDLARELEVKSKAILDVLLEVGVTEKKTHSSSVEEDEAEKVRKYFSARSGSASREKATQSDIKPKIDLSKISKPGDVMKLLRQREQDHQQPPAGAKTCHGCIGTARSSAQTSGEARGSAACSGKASGHQARGAGIRAPRGDACAQEGSADCGDASRS